MRYLNYLEQSFFLKSLQLHTPSVRNRLKAERKPYFVDLKNKELAAKEKSFSGQALPAAEALKSLPEILK